jgi:tetratricopeptide (TPR) repeat protein
MLKYIKRLSSFLIPVFSFISPLCLLFLIVFPPALNAQGTPLFGDAAIAGRYLAWAEEEIARGRWAEALAGLERGADYGDVYSDISYVLALARSVCARSREEVLDALRRSLEADRWDRYQPEAARILEAKTLVELRRFEPALLVLENCNQAAYDTYYWKLRALWDLDGGEFLRVMARAMDSFPRHPGPVRLLFSRLAAGLPPGAGQAAYWPGNGRELVDLALRRLPVLLEADPELAYLAVPFLGDPGEVRRLVGSYRAEHFPPNPASIPAALNLGLIDDVTAVKELFADPPASGPGPRNIDKPGGLWDDYKRGLILDKTLILSVWRCLRGNEGRRLFERNLLSFSGVILEDTDGDGIAESAAVYQDGLLVRYTYDEDQDGPAEWDIRFSAGVPHEAEIAVPVKEGGRIKALLRWERYPAVLHTDLEGVRYIPRPMDYFFTPLRFVPLVQGGLLYPQREDLLSVLTERSLQSFAVVSERPSGEFSGAVERTGFEDGFPVRSRVYMNGRVVAETEFRLGRPLTQRADLDQDGRMETIRHFDRNEYGVVVFSESDWDGDGIYEYAETLNPDGTIKKSWDLNRDGIRETER